MKATKEFYESLRKEVKKADYDAQVPDSPSGTQYSESVLKDYLIKDLNKRLTVSDADISTIKEENAKLRLRVADLEIGLVESKQKLENERMKFLREADKIKVELFAAADIQSKKCPSLEYIHLDTIIDYVNCRADYERAEPFVNMLNFIFRGIGNKDIFAKIDGIETHFREEDEKKRKPSVMIERNYGPVEGNIEEQKNILGQVNGKMLK